MPPADNLRTVTSPYDLPACTFIKDEERARREALFSGGTPIPYVMPPSGMQPKKQANQGKKKAGEEDMKKDVEEAKLATRPAYGKYREAVCHAENEKRKVFADLGAPYQATAYGSEPLRQLKRMAEAIQGDNPLMFVPNPVDEKMSQKIKQENREQGISNEETDARGHFEVTCECVGQYCDPPSTRCKAGEYMLRLISDVGFLVTTRFTDGAYRAVMPRLFHTIPQRVVQEIEEAIKILRPFYGMEVYISFISEKTAEENYAKLCNEQDTQVPTAKPMMTETGDEEESEGGQDDGDSDVDYIAEEEEEQDSDEELEELMKAVGHKTKSKAKTTKGKSPRSKVELILFSQLIHIHL